ncbi:DUF4235 domain-containing protein [Nocardioidaceae bacterium]|nr:DUF4235 domain-containing protein [Nocardioidaceae bacterium]
MAKSSKSWSLMSTVSTILAGIVARKAIASTWSAATSKEPPANPADPDVSMNEAVAWAVFSGALVQVARMLAARRAAVYYTRSTGHLPPGLEKD